MLTIAGTVDVGEIVVIEDALVSRSDLRLDRFAAPLGTVGTAALKAMAGADQHPVVDVQLRLSVPGGSITGRSNGRGTRANGAWANGAGDLGRRGGDRKGEKSEQQSTAGRPRSRRFPRGGAATGARKAEERHKVHSFARA